ncbi:DUF6758 family protein [Nocardiopsis composta]|uniref:Phosphotransacetylase n=1 Tax=Nocardiopsis composta TaxID=157465 RepID=A0A7W8QRX9_9ACTN|nr:DUF6758 family protein [Nocardiopsis composta]MBB5434790.1 hypothetical protein [Nocardiopsis composta]
MKHEPSCPRCGRAVRAPNLWSSAWQCAVHGPVAPLQPVRTPGETSLNLLVDSAQVPVWLPWPLPAGWVVTGFADAGDERSGALGIAVALSGPAPLGGVGEMAIVAEDPGIGLGARLAGMDGPDPGAGFDSGPPALRLRHEGHDIPLWSVPGCKKRSVYAGEAYASWLWLLLAPADTDVLTCELTALRDVRDRTDGASLPPPFGALSPFLAEELKPLEEPEA